MGIELAAAIIGLTLLGLWVDHRFNTAPTGLLVGAGLGIVGGLYNFIRQALLMGREQNAPRPPSPTRHSDDRNENGC